jgi:O-antigen ligase
MRKYGNENIQYNNKFELKEDLQHGREGASMEDRFIPQLLFYAVIFTIPYYALRSITEASLFLKVDWLLVLLLAGIVAPALVIQKGLPERMKSNLWPWILLFIIANLISSVISPYSATAISRFVNIVVLGTIFMALNMVMLTRKGLVEIMPVVLGWSVGINAFFGALEYFFDYSVLGGAGERGTGFTIGSNNMALMSVFTIPLLVHWFRFAEKQYSRVVSLFLIALNFLGVVSSASRGGFLNMVIIFLLIAFELRHKFHPRYLGVVVALVMGMLLAGVSVMPEDYLARQATILEGTDADKSTSRRTDYLVVGFRSFLGHPVLGTGTQTFSKIWVRSEETLKYDYVERPAHNTYMEVLVGSGVVGLSMFLAILWQCWRNFSKARNLYCKTNNDFMLSLVSAYRLSFLSVCMYLFFKSALDHKMYLLIIPISSVVLFYAKKDCLR